MVGEFFSLPSDIDSWIDRWQDRLDQQDRSVEEIPESMRSTNPVVIPRNYHVNDAIEQAVEHDDYDKFHEIVEVLKSPYEWPDDREELLSPPTSEERVEMTFCGT